MKRFFLYVVLVLSVSNLFSQERIIKLLSKGDDKPVNEAFVFIKALGTNDSTTATSDHAGFVTVPYDSDIIIRITHLGFLQIIDTLEGNQSFTYYLEPASISLEEVVVTAQYSPNKANNSVYPVKVINKETFQIQGANNLRDLLIQETNIRITQDQFLGAGISLHGLNGEHIKILVDGVPVLGRENGQIDLAQLNLNNAERIEIIEGPVSVHYGTNASGGVINIITRENKGDQFWADVNGYYESVGQFNIDGGLGFGKKNHQIGITGGRYFFGGYSEIDTARRKDWNPKTQYFGDLKYSYDFKKLELIFKAAGFYEKLSKKGDPIFTPYDIYSRDEYYFTHRYNGSLKLKGEFLKNHYLEQVFAYSFYAKMKRTYQKDLVSLTEVPTPNFDEQDTTWFDEYMARGYISRNKKYKLFNYQIGYDIKIERGTGKKIKDQRQTIGDYAFFTSLNIKPVDYLALQLGFRWSYNTNFSPIPQPSLNIKVEPVEDLIIRASYGLGFRAPSLKELYLNFEDGIAHNIHGYENLEAENSHNVNFNLDYRKTILDHQFRLQSSLLFSSFRSKIELVLIDPDISLYEYRNIEKDKTVGGTITAGYTFAGNFHLSVSGGYTGRRSNITFLENSSFYFSPDASVRVGYTIPKAELSLSVFYKYNGAVKGLSLIDSRELQEYYIGSYNLMDASITRSFWKNRITLTAGVKNLFNVKNIKTTGIGGGVHSTGEDATSVGWGRTFFTSFKFSFAK